MYFVVVPEEIAQYDNREEAIQEARSLIDSGEYDRVFVSKATDEVSYTINHKEVE